MLAQKVELIALTKALQLEKGKRLNIFTESRYAFATVHVHGAIYQQHGLLTSKGKEIKNKQEIIDLLQALHLPKEVSIIHCPGHHKGASPIAMGNNQVDRVTKEMASTSMVSLSALTLASQTYQPLND